MSDSQISYPGSLVPSLKDLCRTRLRSGLSFLVWKMGVITAPSSSVVVTGKGENARCVATASCPCQGVPRPSSLPHSSPPGHFLLRSLRAPQHSQGTLQEKLKTLLDNRGHLTPLATPLLSLSQTLFWGHTESLSMGPLGCPASLLLTVPCCPGNCHTSLLPKHLTPVRPRVLSAPLFSTNLGAP